MPGKSPRNIVITGFMGTGKTTVARIAAGRLGLELVSTDALIEARAGQSIPEIFAQKGEAAFRSLEAIICREVAMRPDVVIDTGGGALLNPTTRAAFTESGLVICLTCAPDEIMRRLSGDSSRPLWLGTRGRASRRCWPSARRSTMHCRTMWTLPASHPNRPPTR
jgi:shikimate kinase